MFLYRNILQEGVNSKGLNTLQQYVKNYIDVHSSNPSMADYNLDYMVLCSLIIGLQKTSQDTKQLIERIKEKYSVQKSKNIEFLIDIHQVQHEEGGISV